MIPQMANLEHRVIVGLQKLFAGVILIVTLEILSKETEFEEEEALTPQCLLYPLPTWQDTSQYVT